ncbi:DUF2339 domain-containing protein [Schinkia sp. CFF1]
MSDLKERLRAIRDKQKELTSEYESIVTEYESINLLKENEEIKRQYETIKLQHRELEQLNEKTMEENRHLKVALHEQIWDEKQNIIKLSKKKLETYFGSESDKSRNKLDTFEQRMKKQIQSLRNKAQKLVDVDKKAIIQAIDEVSKELEEKLSLQRHQLELKERELLESVREGLNNLGSESINEEVVKARIKENQIEMKIGLNWVNKLGILLILFGVGAASKYTYSTWFNDYMKGIFFFLLGGLLLVGGEWAYRKSKRIFATGLLGGGISVLYAAIFYSYFQLNILDMLMGILLSVVVTIVAIVLSLRYQSRTICSFGLVGGYLPFFSYTFVFGLTGADYYAVMGYLLLLNLSVLLISFSRKWNVVNYISFIFHLPSLVYLVYEAPNEIISMIYSLLTFVMYLTITLAYPFKKKQGLRTMDVVLLGINTFLSCTILYLLFEKAGYVEFRGLLALLFAIVYIGLGQFIEKVMAQEKSTMLMFYATSFTFAVLMVPFQFGAQWVSLGWLIEGVILLIYGYRSKIKRMEIAGWSLFLISIVVFYGLDFTQMLLEYAVSIDLHLKYAAVTLAMLTVTFYYLRERAENKKYKYSVIGDNISFFKYVTLGNVWVYLLYTGMKLYDHLAPVQFYHFEFYKLILAAFITIGTAYLLSKIPLIQDRIVTYYRMFLNVIGYFICLYITLSIPVLEIPFIDNAFYHYFAMGILIGFHIFVLFSAIDLIKMLIQRNFKNIEMLPLIISLYLLTNITAFMIVQFRLGIENLWLSIAYLLLAIAFILYGFKRHFVYIRRIGLALSLISTTKLFLFDLSFLTQGSKIFAYFSFGLVLLGISFIYQKVSNMLEGSRKLEGQRIADKN